jgi:hypothetical protein
MLKSQIPLLATLIWAFAAQIALGQAPGHWRGNQYVGFIPKHLQNQTPEELQRAATTYQSLHSHQPAPRPQPANNNAQQIAQTQFSENADGVVSEGIVDNGFVSEDVISDGVFADGIPYSGGDVYQNTSMWSRVELLSWEAKGTTVPSLATTSPDDTAQAAAGVLPAATTLFGDNALNDGTRTGARITFGRRLGPEQAQAIEFRYTFLEDERASFSGSAADNSILARPFFNIDQNAEDARLIVFPDVIDGTLNIDAKTEFQTAEVLLSRPVVSTDMAQVFWSFGYRYANLKDTIQIQENTTSLSGVTEGTTFDVTDKFETKNHFNGGQIGLTMIEAPSSRWSVEMGAKFAFGHTLSKTAITGQTTTTTDAGDTSTNDSGLLALGTNIGQYEDNLSSTISELAIAVRHRFPRGVVASVGYSVMYWSDLGRAGNAIDRTINPTQIPPDTLAGPARPEFDFQSTDFWARGVNFGLEFNF